MRMNWRRGNILFAAVILFFLILAQRASAQNFTTTGSLNVARIWHTATLLNNGMVLISGGEIPTGNTTASAELYNPATGTFTTTGSMTTERNFHTATLLNNGMVLIAGGLAPTGNTSASAELYNPTTGTFTTTGSLNSARLYHTATLLNNGMALIAGGTGSPNTLIPLAGAELYDPATGIFTATGSLNTARHRHTATLLNNGRVLIAGGEAGGNGISTLLASAELYDSATGTFAATDSLNTARLYHKATLLNNGRVLIAGGDNLSGILASAELYGTISDAINALTDTVNSFNLQAGIANSLDVKLRAALASVASNDVTDACIQISSFISEVMAQSGKKLTVDQADQLIAHANVIKTGLGCA